MATLADIRAGLAANLAALANAQELQVTPYMLAEPTPPSIDVFPEEVEYDIAMQRGGDSLTFAVRALVGLTTDRGAQEKLDHLLASSGASSMKTAIESDDTLGGACDDLRVTRCSGYQIYPRATADVLGAIWSVQIETSH